MNFSPHPCKVAINRKVVKSGHHPSSLAQFHQVLWISRTTYRGVYNKSILNKNSVIQFIISCLLLHTVIIRNFCSYDKISCWGLIWCRPIFRNIASVCMQNNSKQPSTIMFINETKIIKLFISSIKMFLNPW